MAFDWTPLIAAGVSIAGDIIKQDQVDQQAGINRENLALQLQDNERGRQAALDRAELAAQTSLEAANISAQTSLENTRKRILGAAIADRGQDAGQALLSAFQSRANRPERFNEAANNLAQLLAR